MADKLPAGAKLTLIGLWALLGCSTLLGIVVFPFVFLAAESAPQEAAIAAGFAAWFVGTYVIVRSVDSMIRTACEN